MNHRLVSQMHGNSAQLYPSPVLGVVFPHKCNDFSVVLLRSELVDTSRTLLKIVFLENSHIYEWELVIPSKG